MQDIKRKYLEKLYMLGTIYCIFRKGFFKYLRFGLESSPGVSNWRLALLKHCILSYCTVSAFHAFVINGFRYLGFFFFQAQPSFLNTNILMKHLALHHS